MLPVRMCIRRTLNEDMYSARNSIVKEFHDIINNIYRIGYSLLDYTILLFHPIPAPLEPKDCFAVN